MGYEIFAKNLQITHQPRKIGKLASKIEVRTKEKH